MTLSYYGWPPRSVVRIYGRNGVLLCLSRDREADLTDEIFRHWYRAQRTVVLGVQTMSTRWKVWNDDLQNHIEQYVQYDLNFDGYRVRISRLTDLTQPCRQEARWKLVARRR